IRNFFLSNSLQYFYTGSSEVPNFPEFVVVGMVNDVQMMHYDSSISRAVPKQDWMKKITDAQYWDTETEGFNNTRQLFRDNIEIAQWRFIQTGGVHIVQLFYGCEWDDEVGNITGYHRYGYDGEDFIVFDLKTETWIAPKEQAFITKLNWDRDADGNTEIKNYLTQECVDWLKKYVNYGRYTLMRTDLPSVSLLQKTPSSPVSCHATGFYPNTGKIVWRKDGEELHEGVNKGEILTNNDGTFQMSADLDLSAIASDDWKRYDCVFQLSGVNKDIITKVDKAVIKTNESKIGSNSLSMIIPVIVAVVVLVATAIIAFIIYKKRIGERPKQTSCLYYFSVDDFFSCYKNGTNLKFQQKEKSVLISSTSNLRAVIF
uniref:Ig-like domain-containing protein n=1 Tax=Oreochromis aureus TaxID=47969 RepID=A0A668SV71_OREAU